MRRDNWATNAAKGALLLFLLPAFAGCAQFGAGSLPPGDFLAGSYIGLTPEQARDMAEKRQQPFRVVKRDGVNLPVTYDYIPGRINAELVSGVVVAFAVEGSSNVRKPAADKKVDESCLVFFDGCNQCRRSAPGGPAACTRKACGIYETPNCLDQ